MSDRPLYARSGEQVFCENGHPYARFTRDMRCGDRVKVDLLTDLPLGVVLHGRDPVRGTPGSKIGPCPACGGRVVAQYVRDNGIGLVRTVRVRAGFIFAEGLRLAAGDAVKSFPLPLRQHFPWAEEFGLLPNARIDA